MACRPVGFYLLRLPVLHIITQPAKTAPEADEQLRHFWQTTILAEAVFGASPTLYRHIYEHLQTRGWPLPRSLAQSLWKYVLRMSNRSTPFGLMAGCSLGAVLPKTDVRLATERRLFRHHRIDMNVWPQLVCRVANDPAVRPQLCLYRSNSLYTVGNEIRYTERQDTDQGPHYYISAIPITEPLLLALQEAETGATHTDIARALLATGVGTNDADMWVDQLLYNGLLYNELEPCITGESLLTSLRCKLGSLAEVEPLATAIEATIRSLNQPDASIQETHAAVYGQVEKLIGPLSAQQPLLQTDLTIHTLSNQLGQQTVQTILSQIDELMPLNRQYQNARLTDFINRFRERFDQQEMPLLTVLDGDFGIGYGNTSNGQAQYTPWIDALSLPTPKSSKQTNWGAYEELLTKKLSQALKSGQQVVELLPEELKSLNCPNPVALPFSFYVFGNLLGPSPEAIDRGNFQFNLLAAEGPSAANLLGRFCEHSATLTEQVRACLRREEQQHPDILYAEIVHWPDDRLGNILIRPTLRSHEIPYVSRASVDSDHQIHLCDLLVSVDGQNKIRLRSKRHGKEVIPRLSTAHNYRSGLSAYQFLADLQRQDGSLQLGWDWDFLAEQPFLPRITYRNLVLSRAKWLVPCAAIIALSADDLATHLQSTLQLPRFVAVADGDNELVIDLSSVVGRELLFDEVRRHASVRLIEWLALSEQCWIHDSMGVYASELVLPCEWIPTQKAAPKLSPPPLTVLKPVPTLANPTPFIRSFDPGSDWLYVKLYAGESIIDELLPVVVSPLLQTLSEQQSTVNSFFVRYTDPHPHLRLRMHLTAASDGWNVLEQVNQYLAPYRDTGAVYRIQVDTYEREVERYGLTTMALSEHLFGYDSGAVIEYLSGEQDQTNRWLFGVQASDALLNDFNLSLNEKHALIQPLQAQFLAEYKADRALRQDLNHRYRADQPILHQLLNAGTEPREPYPFEAIIHRRSLWLKPIAEAIKKGVSASKHGPDLRSLLASYLHMSMNRLFMAEQRTHELVIYHYLTRYYESQQARALKL